MWLIDGNIPFLEGKHILLTLMSIVAVVGFIIPFTLIILCEYPLQSKFGTTMLKYRLTPLIDAYQGPYKTKFRWWTGAMLLVRSVLLIIFSINIFGDPSLNLELIFSMCVVIWNTGGAPFQLDSLQPIQFTNARCLSDGNFVHPCWSMFCSLCCYYW